MTITAIDETRLHATAADALSHLNGFMTSLAVHYGQKVGIYRALQQLGPSSSATLPLTCIWTNAGSASGCTSRLPPV